MAVYFPAKMKRKDLEDSNDEFSDFSLSSPARKIRRLEAELPPMMEGRTASPLVFEQSMPSQNSGSFAGRTAAPEIEELRTSPENGERAIVLFKPMETPLLLDPSIHRVSVDSDLISGLKKWAPWSRQSKPWPAEEDESAKSDNCLAVVPWVPSQFPATLGAGAPEIDVPESMEAEEADAETMDIEDDIVGVEQRTMYRTNESSSGEGVHQWQQQHCMIPQPPQNASTAIVWFQ